ncbi:MAG: VWA domain-containing protein [Anaerolineales bacterium]|nr:VWA domain-containing protein [Anaerolineales bacterium]
MTFIWPRMLFTLLLVPLAVVLYRRLQQRRQQALAGLGALGVIRDQAGRALLRRRHLPPALFLAALALLLFALARPEMRVSLPRVGGTVILAFDVSNSMLANDLEPTRMEAAKTAARAFVDAQPPTILLGVVAFSNGGLVIQPPTEDKTAVLATIDRLTPQGGTSLGQGIFTALNAIAGEALALDAAALEDDAPPPMPDLSSAVVILLTDGENTGPPEPLEMAQLAAEAGVRLYTIGVGSSEGAVLEIEGFSVQTQLDEALLQQLAGLTNGAYYRAADEAALREIYEGIDLQMTIRGEKIEITALIAAASLLLLLAGGGLSMRWLGRIP